MEMVDHRMAMIQLNNEKTVRISTKLEHLKRRDAFKVCNKTAATEYIMLQLIQILATVINKI